MIEMFELPATVNFAARSRRNVTSFAFVKVRQYGHAVNAVSRISTCDANTSRPATATVPERAGRKTTSRPLTLEPSGERRWAGYAPGLTSTKPPGRARRYATSHDA